MNKMIRTGVKYRFCAFQDISVVSSLKSRISGSSKLKEYDLYRNYYNKTIDEAKDQPGITIVKTPEAAKHAVSVLYKYRGKPHAWDTETIDLDVKQESPVNAGRMICASAFLGPEVNFGNGPRLFIDNFAQNSDLILYFKEYFEDQNIYKVWHNYGFDRHIFNNSGINVKGFFADTMHLARLSDPSRLGNEYSLSSLTKIYENELKDIKMQTLKALKQMKLSADEQIAIRLFEENLLEVNIKSSMGELFGQQKVLKNGTQSKIKVFPKVLQMHCLPQFIDKWIQYSTLDTELTYFLCLVLKHKVQNRKVIQPSNSSTSNTDRNEFGINNLGDIYKLYWNPLGELLTDMERAGMAVDLEHVKNIQVQAESDMKAYEKRFLDWVQSTQECDVSQFNCASAAQMQQLLFAPCKRDRSNKSIKPTKIEEEEEEYLSDGRKKSVRKEVEDLVEVKGFPVPNIGALVEEGKKTALKYTDMNIRGLGIQPLTYTPSGLPSTDNIILKQLAGNVENQNYGKIYDHYKAKGEPEKGIVACHALNNLLEQRSIETLLSTFIQPLLSLTDIKGRIHTSLNLNTETGRLSSRNPNLLNQPALEKDRYKIRKSFVAQKGNKLIVADYGQLELRVLAHMTRCKTMIDAFLKGGDFHSRTVLTMYPKIAEEVEKGEVLMEWDKSKGIAPAPLVKDKYASERRKAKTMNFSIAYGKTASGFALDWKCTVQEAKETINAWFSQREEVRKWQATVQKIARTDYYTQTLIGRYRNTEKFFHNQAKQTLQNHGLRAAINTPIQGGAADIVIAAMVKIYRDERLKKLGYKLLLQIHDELILEGPEEHSKEALSIVKELMENPFGIQLELPLEVDAKIGNNWYECK